MQTSVTSSSASESTISSSSSESDWDEKQLASGSEERLGFFNVLTMMTGCLLI